MIKIYHHCLTTQADVVLCIWIMFLGAPIPLVRHAKTETMIQMYIFCRWFVQNRIMIIV